MGILSFYHMPKPRQYDHKPIYYDPQKEALQKRISKVKVEMGVEKPDYELYKEEIRATFVGSTTHLKKSLDKGDDIRNREYKNRRLILIAVGLVLALWYFFLR